MAAIIGRAQMQVGTRLQTLRTQCSMGRGGTVGRRGLTPPLVWSSAVNGGNGGVGRDNSGITLQRSHPRLPQHCVEAQLHGRIGETLPSGPPASLRSSDGSRKALLKMYKDQRWTIYLNIKAGLTS